MQDTNTHKQRIITEGLPGRADHRDRLTIAIDPHGAKDFDDALSYKRLPDGTHEVGIHIADVSHYVRPGSELDKRAAERATSVYLVGNVLHMLPAELSEDKCSLRAGTDKLTFSAIFTLNDDAKILREVFTKSRIRVDKNLSYTYAQRIIKGKEQSDDATLSALRTLMTLSERLRAERVSRGALSFNTHETVFSFNKNGEIISAKIKKVLPTMEMIEDFMLLANERVATFISEHFKDSSGTTGIYRVHPEPQAERLAELQAFLRAIGAPLKLRKDGTVTPHAIQRVLNTVRGTEHEAVVNTALLRTMEKAIYTHINVGHFSLGFENYTHFTSPIRRYPDIMVHRILASIINNEPLSREDYIKYQKLAEHSTAMEIEAVQAERDSVKRALSTFLSDRVGDLFTGTITGVTDFGIFVSDIRTGAEGLVHVTKLPGRDFYEFDKERYQLVGKYRKRVFKIGQRVRMKLVRTDTERNRIDWELIPHRYLA